MLKGNRVLDLTDEKGFLCGTILAGLGADVVKVERRGGDASRNIGPFYQDMQDPQKSLYWFAYNINKRGITLDLEVAKGRELFKELVRDASFVIESYPVGHLARLGLDYQSLKTINPRVIMASITPYGQTGPRRDYRTSDLVSMAEGGFVNLCGDVDRPPVRITPPQAYLHAGAQAAAGVMIAHYVRESTGEGQHIDVSIQESVLGTLGIELAFWECRREVIKRLGPGRRRGGPGIYTRTIWPCKDGHVSLVLLYGRYGERLQRFVDWMASEGLAGHLEKVDWCNYDMSKISASEMKALENTILSFLAQHTKSELKEFALKEHMYMVPGNTPREIAEDSQLSARNYWKDIDHPELGTSIRYPANPCTLKENPWKASRRAPMIGEHNEEIYANEMGMSKEDLAVLKQGGII